jgi:hypothetical protein
VLCDISLKRKEKKLNTSVLAIVFSSLISGLIGVIISTIFYQRMEKKKLRIDTAKKLIGNRHDLTGQEFTQALNEALIVFSDNKIILQALNELFKNARMPEKPDINETILTLFKAVCADVKLFPKNINDTVFLTAFNVVDKPRNIA